MRITMEFEVPAAVVLQIAQLAATHTAEPMLVSDGPGQPEVNAEPAGPTEAESQAADDDGLPYGWIPEQLLRYYAEITDAQRGLLDYLAANPGKLGRLGGTRRQCRRDQLLQVHRGHRRRHEPSRQAATARATPRSSGARSRASGTSACRPRWPTSSGRLR